MALSLLRHPYRNRRLNSMAESKAKAMMAKAVSISRKTSVPGLRVIE
jgi:hypothetical protein